MNIIVMNFELVNKYKQTIISYIKEGLYINKLDDSDEEVNRIYSDMCNFIEDGSAIILGAIENNELLGYIWAYKTIVNKEERLHITRFIVDKSMRGKGIGQKLINSIYEIAKQNKINAIELMATYDNEKTMEFYIKQNFTIERVKLSKKI